MVSANSPPKNSLEIRDDAYNKFLILHSNDFQGFDTYFHFSLECLILKAFDILAQNSLEIRDERNSYSSLQSSPGLNMY